MPNHWIDTHAHLDDKAFQHDIEHIVVNAEKVGVVQMVCVATTAANSISGRELAKRFTNVFPSVGIHPNSVAQSQPRDWETITQLARTGEFVALGETGLDKHWDFTPFAQQEEYFARHWELSRELSLPVIIHSRECDADMLRFLRNEFDRRGPLLGVMHCFAGTMEYAKAWLEMGLYISFAGTVTYKSAEELRRVAAMVPSDRILIETDAPYLTPVPHRGKIRRNEPAFVVLTGQCVAEVRGITERELAMLTTANARRLFKLPML